MTGLAEAAGVVLAGGRSSPVGRPKAALEWHGSTLLHRTTALLSRTVGGPVLVVAAPGQDLPQLPPGVEVVADPVDGQGPMRGLATGLAALGERASVAFVCSTDLPFLHPALVRRVLREFADPATDVVLPVDAATAALAAGYRTSLVGLVETLLGEGNLRPGMLFQHCQVTQLDDDALLADPELARHDPVWTRWSTSTSPTTTRPPAPARNQRCWSRGSVRWRVAGSGGPAPSARPPSAPPPLRSESPSTGTSSRPSTATR